MTTNIEPEHAPIFVIGTGRSGTTLLRVMLNAHPRIYLTHEASFYLSAAAAKRMDGRAWLEHYFHSASFAWLGVMPADVRRGLSETLPRKEIARAFNAVMRTKAAQYDRPRFGDKTPLHSSFLKDIFKNYRDPRVVHIVRDPRATVASLMRMPWAASTIGLNAIYCQRQAREVVRYRDRIHELRLEDLLADPEKEMRAVLDFIGEPWDERVLDHVNHAPRDDVPPYPWFQGASRPPRPRTGPPRWLEQLGPAWVRLVEKRNRAAMRRYRYEPAALDPEPTRRERRRAAWGTIDEGFRCLGRLKRLNRMMRQVPSPHPEDAIAALLDLNPDAWEHYPDFQRPEVPQVPGVRWSPRYG